VNGKRQLIVTNSWGYKMISNIYLSF
jgi:hypothetical protein